MAENNKGYGGAVVIALLAGLVVGMVLALIFADRLLSNVQQPPASPGPQTWTIKAEPFSSDTQDNKHLFVNPKYARGKLPDGINKIFVNPAYGTSSDLLYGVIPVPTNLMEWRIPYPDTVRKDEMANGFGFEDEKSLMKVNGEIGIKNWVDDTHYKNEWGDTVCVPCSGKGGSKNRHKKKDLSVTKENMLNPGVYDQCAGCSDEAPIMPTHVIPSFYYNDEWKSRFRRNIWNQINI